MRKMSGLSLPKPKQFYSMSGSIAGERQGRRSVGGKGEGEGEECVEIESG
jgi:hypothetical protein